MLEFYSKSEMSKATVERVLGDRLEAMTPHHPAPSGEFPFGYIVTIRDDKLSLRDKVETLKSIASLAMSDLLLADAGFDPYQWIYIAANGEANTVGLDSLALDDRDEFVVEYFFNPAWGMIGVEGILTGELADTLVQSLAPLAGFSFKYVEPDIIDTNFREAQPRIPALQAFRQYYLINPPQKFPWHASDEKSGLMTDRLSEISKAMGLQLCYFPPNGTSVENIPGGSDTQKHCIVFRDGAIQRIIYKERRARW